MDSLSFTDVALAVALGNVIAAAMLASLWQFHKHDYNAPWVAYAGFLMPLAFIMLSFWQEDRTAKEVAKCPDIPESVAVEDYTDEQLLAFINGCN